MRWATYTTEASVIFCYQQIPFALHGLAKMRTTGFVCRITNSFLDVHCLQKIGSFATFVCFISFSLSVSIQKLLVKHCVLRFHENLLHLINVNDEKSY